jgi:redox-sensitive bicupin YhaK (pirin superfamily)
LLDQVLEKGNTSPNLVSGDKTQTGQTTLNAVEVAQFTRDKNQASSIQIKTLSDTTRVLLLAGKPLDEPIANYGPFVLNSQDELQRAVDDFRAGRNGFEKAPTWRSEIRNLKHSKRSAST